MYSVILHHLLSHLSDKLPFDSHVCLVFFLSGFQAAAADDESSDSTPSPTTANDATASKPKAASKKGIFNIFYPKAENLFFLLLYKQNFSLYQTLYV